MSAATNLPTPDFTFDPNAPGACIAGVRPYRNGSYRLDAETDAGKFIVHNYGHGGAGMSLAWGTGLMAAEFATDHPSRQAAVIGCGSVGLTCARQLQRRGFDVTIYALAVPPNVTSNMSLAGFTPTSGLFTNDRRTPEWDAQYMRAADISYRQLQLLAGPHFGVSWLDNYFLTEELRRRHARRAPRWAGAPRRHR